MFQQTLSQGAIPVQDDKPRWRCLVADWPAIAVIIDEDCAVVMPSGDQLLRADHLIFVGIQLGKQSGARGKFLLRELAVLVRIQQFEQGLVYVGFHSGPAPAPNIKRCCRVERSVRLRLDEKRPKTAAKEESPQLLTIQ